MFRDQVVHIVIGTVFLFIGIVSCGVAAMRRQPGTRVLVWLGIWSAMYGIRPLADALVDMQILPRWMQISVPYLDTITTYLILVVAALAGIEMTLDKLRVFIKAVILVGLGIGIGGIAFFVLEGVDDKLIAYNHYLAAGTLCVLVTILAVPSLSRKYLKMPDRGVLLGAMLVFALEALCANILRPIRLSFIWDSLGLAVLLFALAYVALQFFFTNERRLQSIENELTIAHDIQNSIIPSTCPEIRSLRIHAAYRPMAYVAGDFYDFIALDHHRIGLLVADVAGHGVPAALIASMIKVAMRFVTLCARDPRELLRTLNRVLSEQLRNQLVTAAYLWIDTDNRRALYSAAGHPPLLRWREGGLDRIESNGLLFGVMPDSDYPVRSLQIRPGDRFLLYTDGLVEPENSAGDSFGDRRLEQVLCENQSCSPSELVDQLLYELHIWQPANQTQQDDITLIVVDVV
jgi:sigma-B regulation protein RsbU (phosphoserine phosphatase)